MCHIQWETLQENQRGLKTTKWPEKWPEKCSQILAIIQQDAHVTIAELEESLKIGHTTIKKMLRELREEGFICRIGPDKGGHWEILK